MPRSRAFCLNSKLELSAAFSNARVMVFKESRIGLGSWKARKLRYGIDWLWLARTWHLPSGLTAIHPGEDFMIRTWWIGRTLGSLHQGLIVMNEGTHHYGLFKIINRQAMHLVDADKSRGDLASSFHLFCFCDTTTFLSTTANSLRLDTNRLPPIPPSRLHKTP